MKCWKNCYRHQKGINRLYLRQIPVRSVPSRQEVPIQPEVQTLDLLRHWPLLQRISSSSHTLSSAKNNENLLSIYGTIRYCGSFTCTGLQKQLAHGRCKKLLIYKLDQGNRLVTVRPCTLAQKIELLLPFAYTRVVTSRFGERFHQAERNANGNFIRYGSILTSPSRLGRIEVTAVIQCKK